MSTCRMMRGRAGIDRAGNGSGLVEGVEVVDRADPLADRRGGLKSGDQKLLGAGDGVEGRQTMRQISGDGGRVGAAGAVGIVGLHALRLELLEPFPVVVQVYDVRPLGVSALDDDALWAEIEDALRGVAHRLDVG